MFKLFAKYFYDFNSDLIQHFFKLSIKDQIFNKIKTINDIAHAQYILGLCAVYPKQHLQYWNIIDLTPLHTRTSNHVPGLRVYFETNSV